MVVRCCFHHLLNFLYEVEIRGNIKLFSFVACLNYPYICLIFGKLNIYLYLKEKHKTIHMSHDAQAQKRPSAIHFNTCTKVMFLTR